MNQPIDVSIAIPCYQEENHILENVKEIYRVMDGTKYSFEIIFVEDASSDNTKEKIFEIARTFPNVKYLLHEKNIGKGGAIASGVKIASGKYIGHIDIDLEISAEYIPKLLAELESEYDIALVKRKINFNPKFILRDAGGIIHRTFVKNFLSIPATDVQSGCKFFRREALLPLLDKVQSKGWFFDVEVMTHAYKKNYRVKQIPGFYIRRRKKSTVNFFSDGIKQFNDLLKFRKLLKKK
ncbi:MAG: glycosyltransferase family 2 protein [Bacteroidetes bacterium]|nr:glycosyltransferase family 2 protein [Bacteroidota bacterium]